MAEERKRVRRSTEQDSEEAVQEPPKQQDRSPEAVEKLISDIDEVLEENAEEFVRSYVQKGGQ